MATRRLFVGLAPDARTASALHASAARLFDAREWRIYPAHDIHLTLCFLGAVDEARIADLETALASAFDRCRAPHLEIAGLGAFPSFDRPRVLWAGVRGPDTELETLREIQRRAAAAIESVGLTFDRTKPFTPHLTVARPTSGRDSTRAFESTATLDGGFAWQPDAVSLFESVGGDQDRYPRRVVARLDSASAGL